MSRLRDRAKKKVGDVLDRLRPPSRAERSTSPTPSHHSGRSIGLEMGSGISTPDAEMAQPFATPTLASTAASDHAGPQAPALTAAAAMARSAIGAISVAIQPSQLARFDAATDSYPPLEPVPPVPAYASAPTQPTVLATTASAVKGLFEAARDGSDLFLPLKGALVGVVAVWNIFDRTLEAKAEFAKLESRLAAFKAIADKYQDEPCKIEPSLQARLESIAQAVQDLWEAVEQRQSRGGVVRVMQSSIDLSDIKALADAISSLLDVFQFESSIAAEKRIGLIVEILDANKKERLAQEAAKKKEKIMKTIKSVLGDNFVSEAADDEQPSYSGCMMGTREGVLRKFVAWVKDDPMSIFWLAGMAGTGKTSIAVSLCRMLRNEPEVFLGGGYFCSRSAGSISRTDVRRILPTLAALLADQSQEFAEALATELGNNRRVGHKPVAEQIEVLLRKPLAALASSSRSLVFLIDALDECSDERELTELLKLLADFECEPKVKFILTSRPEIQIRGTPITDPDLNSILHLHEISLEEVTSDIRLYIGSTLKNAAPEATWYTDHHIELLVRLSGGLFIFASTVLKYVLQRKEDEDRQDRLHKATSAVTTRTAMTSAIDELYSLVLKEVSNSAAADQEELERMKRILACILTTRDSLSVRALAALINITPGRIRGSLEQLHSLVYLPSDDTQPGLRTLHASFSDYLFDRGSKYVSIAATLGHDVLARGCLRRLAEDLCFNISHSQSSFQPNRKTALEHISLSLRYACLHWAHHIDAATDRSVFDEEIGNAFRPKLLFWLEVLSVLGKVGLASGLLLIASSAVKLPIVSQFLRDASEFVASSQAAISESAPHIYVSALLFATKDSLVYRDFAPFCTSVFSATSVGIDRHCNGLVMTLTGHENVVRSVSFSPSGRLLASGSDDGTVRIWDIRTGEEILSPLRGEDGKVSSVAFSPDGKLVASGGEGGAVHVWSVETGHAALPPLRGHNDWVESVLFSPDGVLIASASRDTTVRLWSAETGREVAVMAGHEDSVCAIAFSPDGRQLVSGSKDRSIRFWSREGAVTGTSFYTYQPSISSIAFSVDGKFLVVGSYLPYDAQMWNLETRTRTDASFKMECDVASTAFSPDGSRILLAGSGSIQSWNTYTGQELPVLAGHSDWVYSVAFSSDGMFIASGSADRTVRIWDATNDLMSAVQPLQGHSGAVDSVAVAHDGSFIASGSSDGSVRVWDASTGEPRFPPLLGHASEVCAVDISSDGRLIASSSADFTIRLWDAKTGKSFTEPLLGHFGCVFGIAFSPDSQWLASGATDGIVRIWVWDDETGEVGEFSRFECSRSLNTVTFAPVGRLLAASETTGRIQLWQYETDYPTRVALQANSACISSISFSPDATRLVSAGQDGVVRVWNINGGHEVFVLDNKRTDCIYRVAYSPDDRYIVTVSPHRSISLWDSKTGSAVAKLSGHIMNVGAIAFTPDGRYVVTGESVKTIRVWDIEAALLLSSRAEHDPRARLACATLKDGWLVGPSGELLLWLPAEYRGHIQLPPCTTFIGLHRIDLETNDMSNGPCWGDQWVACWRTPARVVA